MLLTITTTHTPATDLGYLLGKHPARLQSFDLPFGRAHVCYPEASAERCTCALLLDIDPVALVRRPQGAALTEYTSDRPYVASSFMSVAIGRVFHQALRGTSRERQALADTALPLQVRIAALPVRGGEPLLRALFEPLGYALTTTRALLDPAFPQWGESPYHDVQLRTHAPLSHVLRHLTVLIPVLDDDKHYWVGDDEIEKLLLRGEGWLAEHPARDLIARRYLKHRGSLTREALRRLSDNDPEPTKSDVVARREEEALEADISLDEARRRAVVRVLQDRKAKRVIDLGCGEGKLVRELLRHRGFECVVGVDVSLQCLERARHRLGFDEMAPRQRERVDLWQGALTYRDARFRGFDAACLVEVVEHVDPPRLFALEAVVFEHAQPRCVIVTTPNIEYNTRFSQLATGKLRHRDHRFEWTRTEFARWAEAVAQRHGYALSIEGIGPVDPELGAPTQMGVFTR